MCFPRSPAVIVVRGAWSSAPAASPEEPAQRAAGKSPHAAEHEQHEAWAHSQVSGGMGGILLPFRAQTLIFYLYKIRETEFIISSLSSVMILPSQAGQEGELRNRIFGGLCVLIPLCR